MGFIKVPIKVKRKDGSEATSEDRFPSEDILNYRAWHNKEGEDLTAIYFKKHTKRRHIIACMSPEELDKLLGTVANKTVANKTETVKD